MAENLNMNGTEHIPKGTVIFREEEPVQSVALVLKGQVQLAAKGIRLTLGSGNFLGMYDLTRSVHSFSYKALEDTMICRLPISKWEQAEKVLEQQKQYRGLYVTSLNFFIADLYQKFVKLQDGVRQIGEFIDTTYALYMQQGQQYGIIPEKIPSLERIWEGESQAYTLPELVPYYVASSKLPLEVQKNYFCGSSIVALRHCKEQMELFPALLDGCRYYSEWMQRYLRGMILDEKNLFAFVGKMALRLKQQGTSESGLGDMLDSMVSNIDFAEDMLNEICGISVDINRQWMEEIYFALLSDDTGSLQAYEKEDLSVLNDSLTQILEYSSVPADVADEFRNLMEQFISTTDKFARTKEALAFRKALSARFFEVYLATIKKSFTDSNPPLAVQFFLQYGYVSEELLTQRELQTLSALPAIGSEDTDCAVYTMPQWLRKIADGTKQPSKDEYEQGFKEGDPVAFEVENLLTYADRLLNGNLSSFVPVLCSEGIMSKLDQAVVTSAKINEAVKKWEKIDFTIFYREHFVSLEEVGINRFPVVSRHTPDFILFPVYGSRSLLWQDMEGNQKRSHGRMLMPIFSERDVKQEVLQLMGHFRWEKCRSEMGVYWNNYRYPSLTAEYTDYLQFYKKNNNLSPEKKEKVRAQLQQCSNRHAQVFIKDYQDWLTREVTGAMRLNRVAREILYTYCPFEPAMEESLREQNAFQEASRRYRVESAKRQKEFAGVVQKYKKQGFDVPDEVEQTKELMKWEKDAR